MEPSTESQQRRVQRLQEIADEMEILAEQPGYTWTERRQLSETLCHRVLVVLQEESSDSEVISRILAAYNKLNF